MKEMFTVEGEGCEVLEEENEENLIEKFIEHIRVISNYKIDINKVV